MNRYLSAVANDRGMALIIVVIMVPVLTLFCVFASNVGVQDMMVTANDKCHRYAIYDADGAVYGTAKLVSMIAKNNSREPVKAGKNEAAPGIKYLDPEADAEADAEDFARMVSSAKKAKVKFVKPTDALDGLTDSDEEDCGLSSTVTVKKTHTRLSPGGGAEFGNTGGGPGAQLNWTCFRITADTSVGSKCPDTNVQIHADFWLIATEAGQTKGI
jgi:Tfp pilus assembly protein PilX